MNLCNRRVLVSLLAAMGSLAGPGSAGAVGFEVGGVRLQARVEPLVEIRNAGVVRQRWDYSCGSAALSTVLTHHLGDPTTESAVVVSILRRTDPVRVRSRGGFSLLNLKQYLARRGYGSAGYAELTLSDLEEFEVPPIVPVQLKGYDHFVVFRGRYGDRVVLADPAFGNLTMSAERFQELWKNGIAFVVIDVERQDTSGASFDKGLLPFSNLPAVQHILRDAAFPRPGLMP